MSVHHSVPASVEAAFAADLPSLPASTRRLLLLVAAGGDDLAMLSRAMEPSDEVAEALEPAERAGLVRVLGKQVAFRHPLIGSTVYALASTVQRRTAHALLAELYAEDEDRRVWHRAAATDSPDEDVAAALVASADRMWMRGAQQEASDAVVRAAELTVDPDLRDERILAAVSMSPAVGHVHTMAMLGDHLRSRSTHPLVRARSAQLHAYALAQTMDQSSAQDLLQQALDEVIKLDDESGWASLTTLATLTYRTGRGRDVLAHWLERYETITPYDLDEQPLNAAARAWIVAALDPMARPAELHQLLATAPDRPPGDLPPQAVVAYDTLLGATAWLLDEHQVSLRRLTRAAELAQRSGASQQIAQPVMALGQVQFDLGMYDDADRSGRLLVDIGEAQGLLYHRTVGRELRARVAAVRGDARGALEELDALAADIEPGHSTSLGAIVEVGRAHALVALLDHEGAYQALRTLFDDDGAPQHPHLSYLALGDLVAAAVRVGRVGEVAPVVGIAQRQLADDSGDRMARVLARARAQLADDAEAGALFELAVRDGGAPGWPFEWGNAQLEHGVWLRRQRRPADARRALRAAHQVFARLGANAWAAAAEAELRAAGVRLDDRDGQAARWEHLTAQEREIVLLAATGLSNKQIGQTLFLSPRTVGAHLYHAFPKLGVTSRNQLRDVVELLQGR
jgi:DNA-binding CsgD family transcriptional regulator